MGSGSSAIGVGAHRVSRARSPACCVAQVALRRRDVPVRLPRVPPVPARRARSPRRRPARDLLPFVVQSTVALEPHLAAFGARHALIGIVAPVDQVGYFRIAQAPQTAFGALSAPVRLVLLAEQTRDLEHGTRDRVVRAPAAVHRRHGGASMVVVVPVSGSRCRGSSVGLRPGVPRARDRRRTDRARRGRDPARVRLDEVVARDDRPPGLRIADPRVELVVLVPLRARLRRRCGVRRAAPLALLASTVAFCRALGRAAGASARRPRSGGSPA